MTDIVERLRDDWDEPFDALAREAADEIERLRLLRAPLLEVVYAIKTDRTVRLTRSMLERAHNALRDSYSKEEP